VKKLTPSKLNETFATSTALAVAVVVSVAGITATPIARAADLWSLYEQAVDNDPSFARQRFLYQAEQQKIVQARAQMRPNVSLTGSYGRQHQRVWSNAPTGGGKSHYGAASLGLTARQNLYDRSIRSGVETAKDQVRLASLDLTASRQDLALAIAQRYFAALRAMDNLSVAKREVAAVGRQLDLARERLDVGLGTRTDLTEAESRFKIAEVSEIESRNEIDDALRALQELTGTSPAELAALSDDAPMNPPTPTDLQTWIEIALENSLTIRQSRQQAAIVRRDIQRQRDARYPSVDLVFNENLSDTSGGIGGFGSERESRSLALQFSVPLYQGGAISSRIEEAEFRYRAALKSVDALVRLTERNVRDAFLDVTSTIERVDALRQAVEASQATVNAKKEGFDAGVNTNIDVLDAQRDLFRAQRDYLGARYDYVLTTLDLDRAAGLLDDDDVARINDWLE